MSSHLVEIFAVESEELLADLEDGLVALEDAPGDADLIDRIFRAAHTMKGNAGMIGQERLVRFTHVLEGLLEALRSGEMQPNAALVSELLVAKDLLKAMVEQVTAGDEAGQGLGVDECEARLEGHWKAGAAPEVGAPEGRKAPKPGLRVYELRLRFAPELLCTGQNPLHLLEELMALGDVLELTLLDDQLPSLEALDATQLHLGWRMILATDKGRGALDEVLLFVLAEHPIEIIDITKEASKRVDLSGADLRLGEILVAEGVADAVAVDEALASQQRLGEILVANGAASEESVSRALRKQHTMRQLQRSSAVRVDTEKLDRLVNLVGELVIATAHVGQTARDPFAAAAARRSAAETLERISRDLQEQVMTVRMVPLEQTFARFRRVIRDLSIELGKEVQLVTAGAETELDKTMIDQLVDPLKHMVRNCIDHGIERPEVREAAGKPRQGKVELRAQQREGSIVIEVVDDGAGINRERVLNKARERGVVGPDESPSAEEIDQLIFHAGLSTAKEVSEISGRGVGMDVVRRNVEGLNGAISVSSEPGEGSTLRIQLPLTLAIIEGMTVSVGKEKVTFPLPVVVELIQPGEEEVKTMESSQELVHVRGDYLPMVRLYRLFGIPEAVTSPQEGMVVVIENDERRLGVMVDRVLGMEQAVVKSLDRSFHLFSRLDGSSERPDGIAGATILGDGSVSMIIDIHGLERMALEL